ncbi:MAG: hypothetical protein ACODAJ_03610 [Planctomycetota bacterium]
MSDRTQFWLGSVMLALAVGLLAGGAIFPRATWGQDEPTAVVPGGRYSVLTGIRGSTQSSQTLYVLDDVEDLLLAYEYDSRSRELEPHLKGSLNIRRYTAKILEERAKAERTRRPR